MRHTASWGEDNHVVGPDEQDGQQVEDDAAHDLLHHVRHDGEHCGNKVGVVAPADYQRYEYHRKRFNKAEMRLRKLLQTTLLFILLAGNLRSRNIES